MEDAVRKRLHAAVLCAAALCVMLALAGCSSGSTYQPELKDATVTTPTIGQADTLRVGVNTEKSPLAGMGSEKIIGVDVDIAAALADELGLKLSIVDVGSNPEEALEQGKVDIVVGIDSSDANSFWLSEEYLPTGIALFALTSSNAGVPDAASNPTVAAQVSSKSAWAVSNEFGEKALTSTTNLADAFTQLEAGKVKYVASDALIGLYAAHRAGLDTEVVALMAKPSGYCVGVAKNNTALQTTVTDTLGKLVDQGVVGVIEMKWLGQSLDFSSTPLTAGAASAKTMGGDGTEADAGEGSDGAEGDAAAADADAEGEGGAAADAAAAGQPATPAAA